MQLSAAGLAVGNGLYLPATDQLERFRRRDIDADRTGRALVDLVAATRGQRARGHRPRIPQDRSTRLLEGPSAHRPVAHEGTDRVAGVAGRALAGLPQGRGAGRLRAAGVEPHRRVALTSTSGRRLLGDRWGWSGPGGSGPARRAIRQAVRRRRRARCSGSRCGRWRCRPPRPGGPRGGSGGSRSAHERCEPPLMTAPRGLVPRTCGPGWRAALRARSPSGCAGRSRDGWVSPSGEVKKSLVHSQTLAAHAMSNRP